ncbi:EthD domain-containing protein [Stachybotrys elegans]|uniref:EthD domain-containing protein n=1 Tax=Stachybotrys elegans TaxID=80388 RepID=A0A8K0SMK0_9HYPO|nr:EthD domain-containing protein [Stachybotrys elegans]
MMDTEPLIRISIAVRRKPGISEEEFSHYWAHKHGPLASEWLKRNRIVRYVQYHTTSQHRNLAQGMAEAIGKPLMAYDGVGDFWVRRYEDFEAAFLDPEYKERLQPDEDKFVDRDSVSLTVGVDYVCVDNGEIVHEHSRRFGHTEK